MDNISFLKTSSTPMLGELGTILGGIENDKFNLVPQDVTPDDLNNLQNSDLKETISKLLATQSNKLYRILGILLLSLNKDTLPVFFCSYQILNSIVKSYNLHKTKSVNPNEYRAFCNKFFYNDSLNLFKVAIDQAGKNARVIQVVDEPSLKLIGSSLDHSNDILEQHLAFVKLKAKPGDSSENVTAFKKSESSTKVKEILQKTAKKQVKVIDYGFEERAVSGENEQEGVKFLPSQCWLDLVNELSELSKEDSGALINKLITKGKEFVNAEYSLNLGGTTINDEVLIREAFDKSKVKQGIIASVKSNCRNKNFDNLEGMVEHLFEKEIEFFYGYLDRVSFSLYNCHMNLQRLISGMIIQKLNRVSDE